MLDIYLLKISEDYPPEIFIGHLLTGGYGLSYDNKNNSYRLFPKEYIGSMIKTIENGKKHGMIGPEKVSEDKAGLVEAAVNSICQEIEKLNGEDTSEALQMKLNDLLSILYTR